MLAYYFPPIGGAGVQRTVKYVKYLPEYGWESTVVTTRSTAYPAQDPALAAEVPRGTRVIRTPEIPRASLPSMALSRLGMRSLARVAAFPDGGLGWGPGALGAALRAIAASRPDALYSTSAPYSAHLAAWAVHARTGIPWVADFRDEWAANPHTSGDPASVRAAARRLEATIVARATAVTYAADYFDIPAVGAVVIPNGVDEADLPDGAPPGRDGELRLTYVGTLYADQDAGPVFAALTRLVERGAIDPERVRLRIVGNNWLPPGGARCPVPIEATGYVTHAHALREMAAASALVHYVAPASKAPGGKLYEYLASGRPILCVARLDGASASLVREAGAGPVVAPDDGAGIERAILDLHDRWRRGQRSEQPQVRQWVLERYSRRALARRLASVLDVAVGQAE